MCPGDQLLCWKGHLRLCRQNLQKDFADVLHDCRDLGCSDCPGGPPLCNDEDKKSTCNIAPRELHVAKCDHSEFADVSYCDGDNVRICNGNNQGLLAEYCEDRGCQDSPAQCVKKLPEDELCNGTYTMCFQGNIRLCRNKQPIATSETLHSCRGQGCSVCDNGPAICNGEDGQSRCQQATSDRFVTSCSKEQRGKTLCLGLDVRHCDIDDKAFLVEYCGSRGCQSNTLSCIPQASTSQSSISSSSQVSSSAFGKGKKGKKARTARRTNQCKVVR